MQSKKMNAANHIPEHAHVTLRRVKLQGSRFFHFLEEKNGRISRRVATLCGVSLPPLSGWTEVAGEQDSRWGRCMTCQMKASVMAAWIRPYVRKRES